MLIFAFIFKLSDIVVSVVKRDFLNPRSRIAYLCFLKKVFGAIGEMQIADLQFSIWINKLSICFSSVTPESLLGVTKNHNFLKIVSKMN